MSRAGAHVKKRKFHRIGRHAAPTPVVKAAKRAGRVAPAVALAGALAAAPHFYQLATTPTSMAGDVAAANGADSSHGITSGADRLSILHADIVRHASARRGRKPDHPRPASGKRTPSSSPSAGPSPSASPDPAPSPSHSAASPTPTPSPSPSSSAPVTLSCSGSGGLLPANYQAIVSFLMAHGYSGLGAAGIAGNIYQESKGNPESIGTGGGGLIGWTPLPSGFVTGNPAADLQTQLNELLIYNRQWARYIPALNAATSPAEAAYIYMVYFERPGIPAAYNRQGAATAVAAACHL